MLYYTAVRCTCNFNIPVHVAYSVCTVSTYVVLVFCSSDQLNKLLCQIRCVCLEGGGGGGGVVEGFLTRVHVGR